MGQTPCDVVHRENKWRLLRYRGRAEGFAFETPVLMVPSLINRHYVLDLMPGKSLVEWLVGHGFDVFVVDWGTPSDEDRYLTFDEICGRYLGRALRVCSKLGARGGPVHLLGYCLGGTLTTIHTAVYPERVATLTALAAPVDFSDDGLLSVWTRTDTFDVDALVDGTGNVPWRLMQASFQMLKPTLNLLKVRGVVERAWDDQFLDGFFALETWGSDNVSFPGECYRRYITELYRENRLVAGTFALDGVYADLAAITCPTHVVTFEHDHIVPRASAAPLVERVGAADVVHTHKRGGHVGAVVSRRAAAGLWKELMAFWADRDTR